MNVKVLRLSILLVAFVFAATALWFEAPRSAASSAQNANSSTTAAPENTNSATTGRSRRRGRRGRKTAAAATTMETMAMPAESQIDPTAATEQTDLSGTYTGTFDCSDLGLSGETTLTVTGNQFTTSDAKSGRIVASTTRGYTGVALQMGESVAASGTQPATVPMIVSMRAKKSGDRLTLMSVPGSGHTCSFAPAAATRARRTRTRAMPAQPATPAEPMAAPATPAEPATPASTAGPMPPAPPSRGRRGRRGTRNMNSNSNMNMNMNSNSSTNDNTGEGNANPKATPTPTPAVRRN